MNNTEPFNVGTTGFKFYDEQRRQRLIYEKLALEREKKRRKWYRRLGRWFRSFF